MAKEAVDEKRAQKAQTFLLSGSINPHSGERPSSSSKNRIYTEVRIPFFTQITQLRKLVRALNCEKTYNIVLKS